MKFKLGTAIAGLIATVTMTDSKPANACVGDGSQAIGSVCIVAYNFCPRGFAELSGQLVAIQSDTALFSLLGSTYGGDWRTSFGYPDARGRSIVGVGQGPGLTNVERGTMRGMETRTLTVSQLPSHHHSAEFIETGSVDATLYANNGPAIDPEPSEPVRLAKGTFSSGLSSTTVNNYGPPAVGPQVELGGVEVSGGSITSGEVDLYPTGGDPVARRTAPTPVLPPQIGLTWCIATEGIYPSRND